MSAETIRDVLIRIAVEQKDSKVNFQAFEKMGVQQERVAADTQRRITRTEQAEHFKRIYQAERTAIFHRTKAAEVERVQKEALERTTKNFEKMGRGAVEAAGGVAQVTRGMLLLGASSETVDKLVKSLVGIQAGYDIAKGGVQAFKGLNDSLAAIADKHGPAAALAISRVGAAGIAAAAAVGIGDQAFDIFGRHATARRQQDVLGQIAREKGREAGVHERGRQLPALFAIRDQRDAAARTADEIGGRFSGVEIEQRDRARIEKRLADARAEAAKEFEKVRVPDKARIALEHERQKLESRRENLPLGRSGSAERSELSEKIARIDHELGQKVRVEAEHRANATRLTAQYSKEIVDSLKREGTELQKALDIRQRHVDLAKGAVAAEQDRVGRIQQEIGRLDPSQRGLVGRLGQAVQAGTASQEQIDELRGLAPTLTGEITAELERSRGVAAANDLSRQILGRSLTGAGSQLENSRLGEAFARAPDDILGNIATRVQENNEAQAKAAGELEKSMDEAGAAAEKLIQMFILKVNLLTRRMEEAESNRGGLFGS